MPIDRQKRSEANYQSLGTENSLRTITGTTVRRRPAKGRLRGRSGHCLRVRLAHQHRSARRTRMRRRGSWPATACSRRLPQKPQACIVCSELACDRVNPGLPDLPFTILPTIYRTSGSQDPPAGDGPAEDSRSGTGRRRGPGGAGPESPRAVTWSPRPESAAAAQARLAGGRGFLDHQQPDISSATPLRWRNHIFCAAGA